MQDNKNNSENSESKSLIPIRKYLYVMKKLFKLWIILAIIVLILNLAISCSVEIFRGKIYTVVNFSFDGIESGIDPNGNKFNINDIKNDEIINEAINDLGFEDLNVDDVKQYISIEGVVPSDVIGRITNYVPVLGNKELADSRNIHDTSYYPTQYEISVECEKLGLTKNQIADLVNSITEKYKNYFYKVYGYNSSLESAVTAIDFKEYDYEDAVSVFNVSLRSLQNYINELAKNDSTRFRAENGYTFSDLSASIDTICDEDLDQINSYITLYNVTKDKDLLAAKYKLNIEKMERLKKSAEENIKTIDNTIEVYKKNAILILGNNAESTNAYITQTSDAYDNLITQKVEAQKALSQYEQNIVFYNNRIKSIETTKSEKKHIDYVEKSFESISSKIDSLIKTTNETSSEYYDKVLLNNAYTIITPASSSYFLIIKSALRDSKRNIAAFELLLAALYIGCSLVLCFVDVPKLFKNKLSDKKSSKKVKKNR